MTFNYDLELQVLGSLNYTPSTLLLQYVVHKLTASTFQL